jgi:hypothetical protein
MPPLRLLPQLETLLRQIPGVRAASVVTGPDSRPTEIHVLATPGKPAKQVVRDVQSLALAEFDIDIDHRIVSVVQISENEALDGVLPSDETDTGEPEPEPHSKRPLISSMTVTTHGRQSEVTVDLSLGEERLEGHALGAGTPFQRRTLVAKATLAAIDDLLRTPAEVESAAIVDVGGRAVAVTVVNVLGAQPADLVVCGSALVRGDEDDAVARSLLDALNRRLGG